MVEKSETQKHLRDFFALVERQYETKVKTVRRDNGTEYRAMTHLAKELYSVKQILLVLDVSHTQPMKVYSDSKSAIALSLNPVQHERTKHVENDCHFIRDSITAGKITPYYVPSPHQLADILTKVLGRKQFHMFFSKLGIYDVDAPT